MNDNRFAGVKPATAYTCAGCRQRLPVTLAGVAGLRNELMKLDDEGAPVCPPCTARAFASGKARRRIERTVRRQCMESGSRGHMIFVDPQRAV